MLAATVFINLTMSNSSIRSLDDTQTCTGMYYFLMVLYLIGCGVIGKIMSTNNSNDLKLKKKYGINWSETDFQYDGTLFYAMVVLGIVGGLVAGGTGLGIDTLFAPILLVVGFDPRIACATGMYMTGMYSLAVLIISLVHGTITFSYAGFLAALTLVTTLGFMLVTLLAV